MLFGASFLVYLVQEDLFLAGSFADYLHKSNLAFRQADENSVRNSPGTQLSQTLNQSSLDRSKRSQKNVGTQSLLIEEGEILQQSDIELTVVSTSKDYNVIEMETDDTIDRMKSMKSTDSHGVRFAAI